MRAQISRWALGASLFVAVTVGGTMVAIVPAHAQSITGLGQADQQFKKCRVATLDDGNCGASSLDGGGQGWPLNLSPVEPAVGPVPAPCRRSRGSE